MMKIVPAKKLIKNIFLAIILGGCTYSGCSSPEARDYRQGLAEASKKHHTQSLLFFERALRRAPESEWALKAAREGAKVAFLELKEHQKAAEFYKHLVMYSQDNQERFEAQRKLGDLYLENLQDYPKAIQEYSRLAEQELSDQDKGRNRLGLARAYYYQSNFFQAESEINEALKLKIEPPLRFSALLLKGNIYISKKEYSKAADLFRELLKSNPERALEENIPLTLAVCYEEAGDFQNAQAVLETLRGKYNPPEYIELRIKRIQERQKNQPGAKGFRK